IRSPLESFLLSTLARLLYNSLFVCLSHGRKSYRLVLCKPSVRLHLNRLIPPQTPLSNILPLHNAYSSCCYQCSDLNQTHRNLPYPIPHIRTTAVVRG